MNKTLLSIICGTLLVLLIGGVAVWQKNNNTYPQPALMNVDGNQPTSTSNVANEALASSTVTSTNDTNTSTQSSGITQSEVATHNSRESCWSTINGSVYDLTSWIPNHPGGEKAILQICGIDGSAKFNGQHGGAQQQARILAGFKIGVSAQ